MPNVTVQPANLSLCEYTSGTISITSAGNGLAYQWQQSLNNGVNWTDLTNSRTSGFDDNFATTGTTTTKLRLSSVPFSTVEKQYRCVISSTANCGSALTSTVSTVTVWERPVITLQPVNANNNTPSGDPTLTAYTFKTQVTGKMADNINQSFSWHESTDGGRTFTSTLSSTDNTYLVANTVSGTTATSLFTLKMPASRTNTEKITYLYRCLISGVCKNKTTNVVRVNPPPKIK